MPWARASAIDRHLSCPAASWWPRLDETGWRPGFLDPNGEIPNTTDRDFPGSAADWGTMMHAAKSKSPEMCEPWESMMDPVREELWPSHLGQHEVCCAWDCEEGIPIIGPAGLSREDSSKWKAAQSESCVTGESDWFGFLPAGECWVSDLKTGWAKQKVKSGQMLVYGLIWSRSQNQKSCRLAIDHWPRGGTHRRYWGVATEKNLTDFATELNRAWKAAKEGRVTVSGPGCRWCPSAFICPDHK